MPFRASSPSRQLRHHQSGRVRRNPLRWGQLSMSQVSLTCFLLPPPSKLYGSSTPLPARFFSEGVSPLPSPDKKRGKSRGARFSATAATETDAPPSSRIANPRHVTNVFSGKKRGEQVIVTVRGEYGGYDFADVVRLCKAVESGQIKAAWLEAGHKRHDPVDMNVPSSTIRRWLMDDDKYMQQHQTPAKRGVKGTAHWKVESEQRRRTELKPAGGYMGTGAPMLGTHTEQKLFLKMKEESQSGTPYMTDEVAGLLLETAKKLKKVAPSTGLLYTDDTDVAGLHTAFL